jgi:hypothetical protein
MKLLWLAALFTSLVAADTPPAGPALITETIEGVTCHYAPADEALVRQLAPLIAAQNREAMAPLAPLANTTPVEPLSIADFRQNRADYLARIAAVIGLAKPTAMQEECYDGYLENFEGTERIMARLVEALRAQAQIRDLTVAHKTDLLRRLKAGEKIPGFSLDPDGEHGRAEWKMPTANFHDERLTELLKQRKRGRLDLGYNISTKNGVVEFSAQTKFQRPSAPPSVQPPPAAPVAATAPFPVIIPPEDESLPPATHAAKIAKGTGELLRGLQKLQPAQFQSVAALANLLLHETTETGVVDRYLGSRDRRWLCEGVANYAVWKIARDRAGAAAARRLYDVDGQVAQYAALRDKVDLRKWPTSENQRPEDANTPLTKAHYAFAARAVFLLAERHGQDFLPKLFREIGQTSRKQADMRTVEKAYKKLAGEDLSALLAAAMAPVAAPANAARTP